MGETQIGGPGPEYNSSDSKPPEGLDRKIFKLRELAGKVEIRVWPTLDAICADNGIEQTQLPELVNNKIENIAMILREDVMHKGVSELLMFLAQCYHALQKTDELTQPLVELKDEISNYQNFHQTLLEGVDLQNKYGENEERQLRTLISSVNEKISPKQKVGFGTRFFRGNREPWRTTVNVDESELDNNWVLARREANNEGASTIFLKKEFNDYVNSNLTRVHSGFFHATTSAALKGIAEQRALLSRILLKERGGYARSGERADFDPRVFVTSGRTQGAQYIETSWFNEFPIHIGFDEKARDLQEKAPEWGLSLGHEVPIELINAIYVPFEHIEEVKNWARDNSLNIEVYALEA